MRGKTGDKLLLSFFGPRELSCIRTGETIPPIPQRNHVNGKILMDLSAKKIYTNNVFSREPTNPLILTF